MKAILVLDEMPETCVDCDLCFECRDCMARSEDAPYDKAEWFETFTDARMSWCPLRPMPEKRDFPFSAEKLERICNELDYNREAACGYVDGWNACIDAMEGNNETQMDD